MKKDVRNGIGIRLAAGVLTVTLAVSAAGLPIRASSAAAVLLSRETVSSALNGDGEEIPDEESRKTQRIYITEALDELRDMGITPDVVLGEIRELVLSIIGPVGSFGKNTEETENSSTSGTAQDDGNIIAAEEPIPEDAESASEDGSEDSLQATLQETAEEVTEDASEYVSSKVDEAKEQVKESAKEKATGAIESFLDSLFN